MIPFKKLSTQENISLLKFPVYISLLAANGDGILDEAEKKSAVELANTKTFACHPLLVDFFKEAVMVFENNLALLDKELPKERNSRDAAIKKELLNLEKLVSKLGGKYVIIMHQSMNSFKEHVSKAHQNVLADFVFPLPITGITE